MCPSCIEINITYFDLPTFIHIIIRRDVIRHDVILSPLYFACQEGHTDTALVLIEQVDRPHISRKSYWYSSDGDKDTNGVTPKIDIIFVATLLIFWNS